MVRTLTLTGYIDKVIYKNSDNGYTVLELDTPEGTVTAVGTMPLVAEGEQIQVEGDYTTHSAYGKQFSVTAFASCLPAEESSIIRYLSSGIVKGIRAATARKIVDMFGPDALDVIETDPQQLTRIKGISPEKAEQMSASMKENIGIKTILLYFQRFGMTPGLAFKIFKRWGIGAYERLRQDPYMICQIPGIGFETADAIARSMDMPPDSPGRMKAAVRYVLSYNLNNNGHSFLPREKLALTAARLVDSDSRKMEDIIDEMTEDRDLVYVPKISNTDGIYLRRVYECERNICDRVILASKFSHGYEGNFQRDCDRAQRALGIEFAEKQKQAIKESLCHQIMVLTGGPGTGKTTTLNGIIFNLEAKGLTFAIAAPTGRAAKRITELTGKEAKTVHRLLEYTHKGEDDFTFAKNRENPLKYDAIIVDEMSMIDMWLFEKLLDATPLATRLIMVGDINQLPPVGPGSVLKDIIGSGMVSVVELTEIFRQSEKSLIVTNAHAIIAGKMPDCSDINNDFFFLRCTDPETLVQQVRQLYVSRLPAAYGFDPMTDIQIICPTKKTGTGSVNLNLVIKEVANPASPVKHEFRFRDMVFREGDKVMQIRNNYDAVAVKADGSTEFGIFNGDIGRIVRISEREETVSVDFDGKTVDYTPDTLEELDLAYAITVHKSQGSEFRAVILPLLEGADILFTRNLLYTAVTRAKQLLIIIGSPERMSRMIANKTSDKRYSGLKYQMLKAAEE